MPVELQSTNPEIWQTHDAQWMATRTAEWRNVLHRLREPKLQIKHPQMQMLKSYFFTGAHCPVEEKMIFGAGIAKMYVWWLHPEEPKEYSFGPNDRGHLDRDRDVFKKLYNSLHTKAQELNSETYGAMGGREQSLMRALNPGMDWQQPHKLGGRYIGDRKMGGGECWSPKEILRTCIASTSDEIKSENYLAFRPGVVLWDHLDFALEHNEIRTWMRIEEYIENPELLSSSFAQEHKTLIYNQVKTLLKDLLTFFDRAPSDAALQRPRTVALVEELVGRYERRDFCDNLLWHWDAAKSDL